MLRPSLIDTVVDLLSFHQSGNFGKFDRCFAKACRFHDIQVSAQDRARLRNFAFHYLRCNGFIDVSFSSNSTRWSVAPETVVDLGPLGYVPIGPGRFRATLLEALGADDMQIGAEPNHPTELLVNGVQFYPELPRIRTTRELISQECEKQGTIFVIDFQASIFERLPTIKDVFEKCFTTESDEVYLSSSTSSLFDPVIKQWTSVDDTKIRVPGLYRRDYRYSPSDYYIAWHDHRRKLQVSKAVEREWFYIAAMWKLQQPIVATYSESSQTFALPKIYAYLKIPTLLERALRAGNMLIPSIDSTHRSYKNLRPASVWLLAAKYPVFKVEKM